MKFLMKIVTLIGTFFVLSTATANSNCTATPSNFIQFNLSANTSAQQPGHFYCSATVTEDPTVLAKNQRFIANQTVDLVNYAAMVDGFIPTGENAGTVRLTVSQLNHFAFSYYYDSRLPHEQAFVQLFVARAHYHIRCYPGRDNRPLYGKGIYG